MGIWSNAFKITKDKPLTEDEKKFLVKVCGEIKKRKMEQVALLILEGTLPVHNISSQLITFALPFLRPIFKEDDIKRIISILEKPLSLDFMKENL